MPDLLDEDRLTLAELAQIEGVNICTVWRWAGRGVKGVVLETFSSGAKRFTTKQARARFIERCTAAAQGMPSTPTIRTGRQRNAAVRNAEDELARLGV